MDWNNYIISDKDILSGKPVIKGSRISVEFLLGLLADGWTEHQILENYPQITQESLKAVFAYVKDCLQDGLLYAKV